MTDLYRVSSDDVVGLPVTLADGTRFVIPATILINASGTPVDVQGGTELDTQGNVVPTYKAHTFTYDTSGNLVTDTVSDAGVTWVRTFTYIQGAQQSDSGWVKQ